MSEQAALITADTLRAIDLFADLPAAVRAEIATHCRGGHFEAGDQIVFQEDSGREVFFIVSGSVRVTFHSRPGKDVQFRDQHAGELFGELSAVDGRPRSAEVTALESVFVGMIPPRDFCEVAAAHPVVAQKLFVRMATLIRSLTDRVVELSTLGVSNRIHAELLRLARAHGVSDNQSEIRPAPTHADIASRVSTQREAVTREIGALVKSGIVQRKRGALGISDVARLEHMVINAANL